MWLHYCNAMSMSFQKIVIAETKRQKLSGYRVAKLVGGKVGMRMIQNYLSGNQDMAGERIAAVAEALGLELRPTKQTIVVDLLPIGPRKARKIKVVTWSDPWRPLPKAKKR